jgi:glucose-1-phosphate adenylyltransferase
MHDNLIILAGGASSRMKRSVSSRELSVEEIREAETMSKSLIKLGKNRRPLTDYLLLNAKASGYKNIYILIGEVSKAFKDMYGHKHSHEAFNELNFFFPVQYVPSDRSKPLGTADALVQAMDQFPELKEGGFTVCNSDNLYSKEAFLNLRNNDFEHAMIAYDRNALIFPEERIAKFAVTVFDHDFNLTEIVEKPDVEQLETYKDRTGRLRISMNIFKFTGSTIYPYLKNCPFSKTRDEKEIPTAIVNVLKDGKSTFKGIPMSEHVPDLTSKEDINIMKAYLSKHFPDF